MKRKSTLIAFIVLIAIAAVSLFANRSLIFAQSTTRPLAFWRSPWPRRRLQQNIRSRHSRRKRRQA